MSHTHYSTPSGITTPENYSTARDLARLAEYDRTGLSYGVEESFAEFREQLERALAERK